jgi:hypothetical protein
VFTHDDLLFQVKGWSDGFDPGELLNRKRRLLSSNLMRACDLVALNKVFSGLGLVNDTPCGAGDLNDILWQYDLQAWIKSDKN